MSRHHRASGYTKIAKTLRARLEPTLPRACCHCGKPVHPSQLWDVAHLKDLGRGDYSDVRRVAVAHRSCNRSAGGKLGAAMQKAPATIRARPTREVKW